MSPKWNLEPELIFLSESLSTISTRSSLSVLPLEQVSRKLMNDSEASSPVYQIQQP